MQNRNTAIHKIVSTHGNIGFRMLHFEASEIVRAEAEGGELKLDVELLKSLISKVEGSMCCELKFYVEL